MDSDREIIPEGINDLDLFKRYKDNQHSLNLAARDGCLEVLKYWAKEKICIRIKRALI